jgi:ribonuclease HI
MIDIYADGGCNPNPGVGGWGIVTYQNGKEAWTECGEIKNLDLVKEAYALYLQSKARIIWVKGHSGVKGNERADRLANEGRTNIINSRILESV